MNDNIDSIRSVAVALRRAGTTFCSNEARDSRWRAEVVAGFMRHHQLTKRLGSEATGSRWLRVLHTVLYAARCMPRRATVRNES